MEYYRLVQTTIDYIDAHLDGDLALDVLARRVHLSKFYFQRIFSAVVGQSLKDYVAARRLNRAIQLIQQTNYSLTDIAYALRYSSQSAFIRSFKRAFNTVPSALRKGEVDLGVMPLPSIVERSFKNLNGDVVRDFSIEEYDQMTLVGQPFVVDASRPDYPDWVNGQMAAIRAQINCDNVATSYLVFSNCLPDQPTFRVFYGVKSEHVEYCADLLSVDVPTLLYATFIYSGNFMEIGELFSTDLARFLTISRLSPRDTGIDLIQVIEPGHSDMADFQLRLPIERLRDEQ